MNGSPTYDRVDEAALERHRQIHFFLERLEQAAEALDDSGTDLEPLHRLPAVLDSLRERLEEHNRDEDDGGLLQSVVDVVPDAEDQVLHLTEQHDRLTEALSIARMRAATATPADVAPMRAELVELVRRLREHERAEEALLERALAAAADPGL
jgi:hypothetical protein